MAVVSFKLKFTPGILNLVTLSLPKDISLLTVAEVADTPYPIKVLLDPVVRLFEPVCPA